MDVVKKVRARTFAVKPDNFNVDSLKQELKKLFNYYDSKKAIEHIMIFRGIIIELDENYNI